MSIKQKIRNMVLSMSLAIAVIAGAPMRPEEIEELLLQVNQPKIAHTLPDMNDDGDDAIRKMGTKGNPLKPWPDPSVRSAKKPSS